MTQSIVHVALVVRDYDEAIEFYTKKLNFTLVEDTYQPEQDKRWVVVAPPGSAGTSVLLARACKPQQETFIGNQTGGRVFLFLNTDDFWRDYNSMISRGVAFVREPKVEPYGTVAVFQDLHGNLWDLLGLNITEARGAAPDQANSEDVSLEPASARDADLLANLLELYIHDLSEAFPLEIRADGRFGYDKLPLYWSEPHRRFPFLVRSGTHVVGFVLVTRGSPASDNPDVFDVAEFFVVRRHRRAGVARRVAFQVWDRFPGRWTVRVSEANVGALPFWVRVITEYTSGAVTETTRPGSPSAWHVFSFESPRGPRLA